MDPSNDVHSSGRPDSSSHSATSFQDRGDAFCAKRSEEMTPTGFQAVNSRAAAENGRTSGGHGGTTPHQASTVAPSAPQTASSAEAASTSHPSLSQLDGADGAMTDNATYGTRSRNRTGTARPNYAEDQDMDFEASAATSKKKAVSTESATGPQSAAEAKRAQDFARFVAVNNSKESTPTASNAQAGPSKKRKAENAQPQSASATPVPPTRKPAASAASMTARESNVMTFTKRKSCLNKNGELIADDGTKLAVNDHVYLVCEPPGEPYYLCRIMEFLHVDSENPNSPVDSLRVNWYYRPRDVQRFNNDSRLLYGTMHSDTCPITSLRGKCSIKHRSEIEDLEAYRKERDSFYYVQVFDRFIRRWYECIPVAQIINVPEKVKKALDERWKFVVVEIGRVKELTSAVKTCKRCAQYCASHDSVDCAICKNSYHMNCVQPPLPKKPSRGFAWACGPCSRASEKKLEAHATPVSGDVTEAEEEVVEEEEQQPISDDSTRAPSPSGDDMAVDDHPATQAEIAMAKMWPMRYLGIHARVEDALQYDDRAIYPRASSRLGPRHQANVNLWHGQPVELVKPAEIKKRYNKNTSSHKKDGKLTKETIAALDAEREERAKRPKWVQDEPPGYVARGEDYPNDDPRCTAKLMWKMPEVGSKPEFHSAAAINDYIDSYLNRAKGFHRIIGVPPFGVNFLDKCMELLRESNYNDEAALKRLKSVDRKTDLHEPVLTKAELIKFEDGVAKYGSEHRLVRLHMKTQLPHKDIVRFYYLWKKTPKGKEIWGNFAGRKGSKRKVENDTGAKVQAEVANDGDDSAFDNDKAARRNRGFQCKFCSTTHSRQWRRAPGVAAGQWVMADGKSGKKERLLLALCLRCAGLWRKYAIQWEDIDEVAKKVAQGGGRAWKRRIDEELLRELLAANEAANMPQEPQAAVQSIEAQGEPPKKKSKTDKDTPVAVPEPPKKKEKPLPPPKEPTPPPPPIIPNQPQWKVLPCSVCRTAGETIACSHCKLTVHRRCFGLSEDEGLRSDGSVHWVCEQCHNDRHPEVSTEYACCLCLTEETYVDLVEPPRVSHKKKTDREREKERMEKELADAMRADYRNKQLSMNRPCQPREPLKRTTGNNWVHVYCAVWTPEIRFSNAPRLEVAEGFQLIPQQRYEAVCKLCKNKDHVGKVTENAGACVSCFQCQATFHAACAFEAGYQFGFDVTPVKGSRKDQVTTAKLGEETGSVTATIWCKEHVVKSIIHPMNEVVDESGNTALQVFVESYKQADLTLTGTVRKANLVQLTKDKGQQALQAVANGSRRDSLANNSIAAAVRRGARTSSVADAKSEAEDGATQIADVPDVQLERRCMKCKIDVTPRWHVIIRDPPPKEPTPPRSPPPPVPRRMSMTLGEIADLERQRSEQTRNTGGVDITGAPINNAPLAEPGRTVPNIRFMAPGANGRAWEGMPDRYGHRPAMNGDARSSEPISGSSSILPSREMPAETNGTDGAHADDGYHNHALPRFQNPAAATTATPPPAGNEAVEPDTLRDYLCHKCFVKRKLDPTPSPPPPPPPAPVVLSPPRQFPLQLDWNRPPAPPAQAPPAGQMRFPWDEMPRSSQPASQINGVGPQHPYGAAPPPQQQGPPQGSGYPPYGQQPNGYHPPPPHMHERQPSYGYGPPPTSNPPQPHQPYVPHAAPVPPRPSPSPGYPGYPPTSQPMPNGNSPHVGQSPTYAQPPPYQQQGYQRRTESPFTSQLPPIGQPLHSSPATTYARPEQQAPPPPQQQQQQQQTPQNPLPPPSHQQNSYPPPPQGYPPPPPSATQSQPPTPGPYPPYNTSPQVAQARPDSQSGRPSTPPRNGTAGGGEAGTGGASASPSLRNLLS